MTFFLLVLVMSVFLGSKLLAIPTPVAQITIYRVCALSVPLMLLFQVKNNDLTLKLLPNSDATRAVIGYFLWWLTALISVLWVIDIKLWFQAVFLMSLGVFVIVALYFWCERLEVWYQLIFGIWGMICFLILWGYYEIITGIYLYADLTKLDQYRTFTSRPLTRIPITFFANQNDYATLLLAFLAIATICYHRAQSFWLRIAVILSQVLAMYLIYRSGSRMALLMLIFFLVLYVLFQFKLIFSVSHFRFLLLSAFSLMSVILLYKPNFVDKIMKMILSTTTGRLSGDAARINLWKNGIIFLSETFGLGVGAGNIEAWMNQSREYPTNLLVNIHNWWLEILVGYGLLAFMIYLVVYGLLLRRLVFIMKSVSERERYTAMGFVFFMIIFIFSSITSANNMLIEWHWVLFGMLISYVKLVEKEFQIGGRI